MCVTDKVKELAVLQRCKEDARDKLADISYDVVVARNKLAALLEPFEEYVVLHKDTYYNIRRFEKSSFVSVVASNTISEEDIEQLLEI